MDESDSHENRPITPPRAPNILPPFTPRTPLRKRAQYQKEHSDETTPIKDINLASGASIIVRGVGANKKNSDPVELMKAAILKIRTIKPNLPPVVVKPFQSRNDWTTTCYIHVEPHALSKSHETEPRTDLLELWMGELANYDPKWHVAWTPAKYGQDKRMWVRFPDLAPPINQEEAKEKVLAWAAKHKFTVCSSYYNKGGVTLTLASPNDVDQILQQGHVNVQGIKDTRQRISGGRQIEIQNPFELIIIGALSEYEGLDELIEKWVEDEFLVDGESTLAGARSPPNEREAFVFHMTSWSSTANVLSPAMQASFAKNFEKYKLMPPQMLHKVNTDAAYRIVGSIREDFSKGAESMNKGLLNITRRLDDMEQQNKQQHQMTQLQLTAVTTSLTAITNSVSNLEDRVSKTQNAILAQSREIGLTRNITDNSVNMLTLQMQILLEKDPAQKTQLQELLVKMQAQGAQLAATIQNATNDFQAIVSQAPIAQIMQAPLTHVIDASIHPVSAAPKRSSDENPLTLSGNPSAENIDAKRRRLDNVRNDDGKSGGQEAMQRSERLSSVHGHIPQNPNQLIVAHDGTSVSVTNKSKACVRKHILYAFRGVLDKLKDLSRYRHCSPVAPCRSLVNTNANISTLVILIIFVGLLSAIPVAEAMSPPTSTFSIYALNANGLVQPIKLNHINEAINARKPHVFVIGETKTQSKLSKSLPYLDYDIYEEPGERCDGHHIFKWGIVMGIRKDVQVVQRMILKQESFKGRVIVMDVVLPNTNGNHSTHRLIGTYAPWNPGGDDRTRPFWSDMTELCLATNSSWTVAGDLNATVSTRERQTGGQEAQSQFLQFLENSREHDLWSDNEDRTRRHDWTCRSTSSAEGNIIDRVVSSSSNLISSEIYVADRDGDWIPSTDHRGIVARINYAFQSPDANPAYNLSQDFRRQPSSKPRLKIPTKKEKEKYQTFQEMVDIKIKDKLLNLRSITDDDSFIQQYTDLTEIINTTASTTFGHRKAFQAPKIAIMNGAIQIIVCQIRTIGATILFEKSNQTHHVSDRAKRYHSKALRAHEISILCPDSCSSFLQYLHRERKVLHKALYAEKAKEIMLRARNSDRRRISMALNGSTKKMLQSTNFVPLPFALNDLDDPEKLVCDPQGIKATTREYFMRLYDHTRIPNLPKPWLHTESVVQVKSRVEKEPFHWPRKATLADFCAMIRRGNHSPSPGPDRWEKWTIKALSDDALSLVLDLHNYEVMNSCFPGDVKDMWLTTIYKKGLRTDLKNWRGLCFSNFLANSPMTWLNQCLIKYSADKNILPDTQVAAQPGVQTRDLMSYLSGVKCWAQRNKKPVYALKRDQMKGFDYLSPDGFYDAIRAYGLPSEIIDLDRAAQHQVKCFIQTAYGATTPITVLGVSKQGGPVSPLKSTYTTSMGHYYLRDILKNDKDSLKITSMSMERKDPHIRDAHLNLLVAMVEATDDSYIFSKSEESLRRTALIMERFQYAYGWLTQWSKSNAYILAPEPGKTYPDTITFESVTTGLGMNPLDITKRTISLIRDDMDFLRTKVDNPSARFNEMKQIIEDFQFPTVIGRLPLTVLRKIVGQNVVSKCRALLSLQPLMPADAKTLDRLIMKKVHEALGFPFQPSTEIAMLPVSAHGFGFPSISIINTSLSMEGLQRDLNHHIPAYHDMARITMADWICEKADCLNPIDGSGQQRDFRRQLKQIPASWITAQIMMKTMGMSLKQTDQSEILQGEVSLSHMVNICNHRTAQSERVVNGTTLLSLKRKGIFLLKHIGKWDISAAGTLKINTAQFSTAASGIWTPAATANWKKIKDMLENIVHPEDLIRMPDLMIPRQLREQRAERYIQALANVASLGGSMHTDGKTWATDGSAIPASARVLDMKYVTGAAVGRSSLVLRIPGRNISILNGEQTGLIIALIETSKDTSEPDIQILTDHLNSVRLI